MTAPFLTRLLDLAVAIQRIPAPTFAEDQRAAFLFSLFRDEGLPHVEVDQTGNVLARLDGEGSAPPLIVCAHSDTVFPASTDLSLTRTSKQLTGPGIGDNAIGLAALFGLVWALRERANRLPGDVWLIATVGEEGLGNLRGMRTVVDRFGSQPLAYIALEGMALGHVYHRGLGVQRYRITVQTPGGHAWVDYGRPSAIHELAALITHLAALPLPQSPRTILNPGLISGGISVNSIAAQAALELDLRSEEIRTLANLAAQVEFLVAQANRPEVKVTAEIVGQRPAGEISPQHPLAQLAVRSLESVGIQPHLHTGSTDANLPLSLGLPAICIGLTTGSGAHTLAETIHLQPLAQGFEQLVKVVEDAFGELRSAH